MTNSSQKKRLDWDQYCISEINKIQRDLKGSKLDSVQYEQYTHIGNGGLEMRRSESNFIHLVWINYLEIVRYM